MPPGPQWKDRPAVEQSRRARVERDKSFLSFLLDRFHEDRPAMQYSWYRKVEARPGFGAAFGVSAGTDGVP